MELRAAVAAQRAKQVPREALGMYADEHRLFAGYVALDQRYMDRTRIVAVGAGICVAYEVAPARRHVDGDFLLDELLAHYAVTDELLDRDDLEPFALRKFEKLRKARHRSVVVHYLADHARRVKPR